MRAGLLIQGLARGKKEGFSLTILVALIIFGVLIFVHEFGHFVMAKLFKVKVHEFSLGMGPAIFKRKKGETDYSVRLLPIGGFVKLEGEDFASDDERSFNNCHPVKRIIILIAGAFMNVLIGFLLFILIFSLSKEINVPEVSKIIEGSPAYEAGLEVGDRISAINGKKIHIQSDVTFELFLSGGNETQVTALRGGEELTYKIVPVKEDGRYIIGFYTKTVKPNFGIVFYNAFYNTFFTVKLVYTSLKMLIMGTVSITEMAGPVGIVGEIGQAAKVGFLYVIDFAALIAVNLGVMNLLPLPALDGGRVVFVLLEIVRRKPLKENVEGYIHLVGLILLFLLMIIITFSDILKLVG